MDAIRYYVKGADNGTYGPVDLAALAQWVAENRLAGNTLVQIEGSQRWQLASTIPEIAALLPGYVAPAPTTPEPIYTDTSIPLAPSTPGVAGVPLPTSTSRPSLAYSSIDQVTNALAFGSMLCGILSLIGCNPIAGTVAIVCGHMGRKQIRQRPERFTGDGMALAGMIMGYISAGLFVAFFVLYIVMIVFVVAAGAARP